MDSNTCKALFDSIKQMKSEEILLLEKEKQKLTTLALEKIEELKILGVTLPQIIKIAQVFADREYELKEEIANKKEQLANLSTQKELTLNLSISSLTVASEISVDECEKI